MKQHITIEQWDSLEGAYKEDLLTFVNKDCEGNKLLNIGQMIDYLVWAGLEQIEIKRSYCRLEGKTYWLIYNFNPDWPYEDSDVHDYSTDQSSREFGKSPWGRNEELCDALWEAITYTIKND